VGALAALPPRAPPRSGRRDWLAPSSEVDRQALGHRSGPVRRRASGSTTLSHISADAGTPRRFGETRAGGLPMYMKY